jgi:hypothetical protein
MFAAGIMILLAVFGGQTVFTQSTPKAGPVTVNEAKAHAVLAEESICFELPLTAPAVAGERAVAWLLSPTGKRSGETSVDLRMRTLVAVVNLPRLKDEHGQFVKELGWYRIGYRIEAPGRLRTEGIVAVGTIAPNLMEMRLARPLSLVAGKPIRIRVYAGNPITRAPFSGVQLKATLELGGDSTGEDKSSKRTIVREAITDGSGEALLTFPKKEPAIESVSVTVHGILKTPDGGHTEASIESDLAQDDRADLHMETDKPMHKPWKPGRSISPLRMRARVMPWRRPYGFILTASRARRPHRDCCAEAQRRSPSICPPIRFPVRFTPKCCSIPTWVRIFCTR